MRCFLFLYYLNLIILTSNNSFFIGFGCSEKRIITVEQYEEMISKTPKQTFYRPPGVH